MMRSLIGRGSFDMYKAGALLVTSRAFTYRCAHAPVCTSQLYTEAHYVDSYLTSYSKSGPYTSPAVTKM